MSKSVISPQLGKKAKRRIERQQRQRRKRRHRIIVYIAIITTTCAFVSAFKVIPYVSDLRAFRQEQASLSELSPFDAKWRGINPDYVGWLKIDGTSVDFPVVRGSDNIKYLNTTFGGEENRLGAIFMDYRCAGEDVPHIIIYGHQVADENGNGLMFGGLQDFLDAQYLANHPTIMFMENDSLSEFEIFSARITDINDPVYHLDFSEPDSFGAFLERNGAPSDVTQIITLSTCVGANNERRMIVQGVLRKIVQVNIEKHENDWTIIKPD